MEHLLERYEALEADEDAWNWLDNDPSVAWDTEDGESYHGSVRAILEDAGWERCYHGDGLLHFNVKMNGNGAYRGFQDSLNKLPELADSDTLGDIADQIQDDDLWDWWENMYDHLRYGLEVGVDARRNVYQCGRSGGYVNISRQLALEVLEMIRFAEWLGLERAYYNSRDYGERLAEMAWEQYENMRIEELASARPERVEA